MANTKRESRLRRKKRIRQRMSGTAEKPRLTVFRSIRHIGVQVIDDMNNRVLAACTTDGKANQAAVEGMNKTDQAKKIGSKIAELCKGKGIESVVFDRNGYRYHGRVKALAAAARSTGLKF